MSEPQAPQVLVVGAGPAGLTLAIELVRRGVAVRIVDRAATPHEQSRALTLNARTLEIFDDLHLIDAAIDAGHEVHGVNVYSGGERVVHVGFADADLSYPFNLVLPQGRTERLLVGKLEELGVTVERGVELQALAADDTGVTATLLRPGRGPESARATWIAGCDGARSTVRALLSQELEDVRDQSFVLADAVVACGLPHDEAHVFQSTGGLVLLTPMLGADKHRVVLDNPPRNLSDAPDRETLQTLVAARAPDVVVERVIWSARLVRQLGHAARFRSGRVFLVGDAAHVHGPFGDAGLNLGIQDAYNLGWKLALVATGRGRPELLDSYDPERRGSSAPTRVASDAVIRAIPLRQPVSRDLREKIAAFLLTVEVTQRKLGRVTAGAGDFRYLRSPIAKEHRSALRDASLIADRSKEEPSVHDWLGFGAAPGPGEHVPDVPTEGKRLHDLMRGVHHTLLLFDGGAHTRPGYENLSAIAERASRRAGDEVKVHIVVPRSERPADITWNGSVLLDDEGALHRRFGAGAECLYLVRPDGYVGFRSQPARWEALEAYLDQIFTPAAG
jgi:2-polyprenyl-6-methoxyphenol hydroxylase-like FAD-dependent oxidoreductase